MSLILLDSTPVTGINGIFAFGFLVPKIGFDLPKIVLVVVDAGSKELLHLVFFVQFLCVTVFEEQDFLTLILYLVLQLADHEVCLLARVRGVLVFYTNLVSNLSRSAYNKLRISSFFPYCFFAVLE